MMEADRVILEPLTTERRSASGKPRTSSLSA